MAGQEQTYDDVPYTSYPYRETHPRRMQGVAHLYGMPAAKSCRVLELGCAGGGNLVPMGEQLPGGEFVGVDYSAVQIAQAAEFAAGAGVKNVRFLHASIADVGKELGEFDYVIVHGVFSWVTRELQGHIFRICNELLTPCGMAFVSFNVLPGWHNRSWVREAMLFHSDGIEEPGHKVRAATEFLRVLAGSPLGKGHQQAMLREELGRVEGRDVDYVLHEYLEETNEPLYFQEFMAMATGLQYVADGRVNAMPAEEGWGPARELLVSAGPDVVRREQYADFLRNRSFRRATLCRAGVSIDRAGAWGRVAGMWASGKLRVTAKGPEGVTFAGSQGGAYRTADRALIDLLQRVTAAYPGGVRVEAGVAQEVLRMWEINLVELYLEDGPGVGGGGRPRGSGVGRWLAGKAGPVTNLRHEMVMLDQEQRRVLMACDGRRDVAEVARAAGVAEGRGWEVVEGLGKLGLMMG